METWQAINGVRVVRESSRINRSMRRTSSASSTPGGEQAARRPSDVGLRPHHRPRPPARAGRGGDSAAFSAQQQAVALVRAAGEPIGNVGHRTGGAEHGPGRLGARYWERAGDHLQHDLAHRLLGLPADRRCDFLLSFGYPADPTCSRRRTDRWTLATRGGRPPRTLVRAGAPVPSR